MADLTLHSAPATPPRTGISLRARIVLGLLITCAVAVVFFTNRLLTERFTETTRNDAQLRAALYAGNLLSELQRNSVVPLLLSRDPALINALNSDDYTNSSARLISYLEEIEAASLVLLDRDGRIVATSARETLGASRRSDHQFVNALRSSKTVFTATQSDGGGAYKFAYSRKVEQSGNVIGVIVVGVDLRKFEDGWSRISDAVLVTDSQDNVILATEPRWRGKTQEVALSEVSAPEAVRQSALKSTSWSGLPPDVLYLGEEVLRQESRVAFQGWKIVSFTSYASIRERVNAFLSFEIMGFAVVLTLLFYFIGRRAHGQSLLFAQETAELRQLNETLQREVTERKRAQEHLEVAEQTLEQSSKLAALGEMSAAVSHELNQPLAAMKTYLAGAKLLLERKRPEEALSSFQRIDDLIGRMGAITRQLKSYARKGADSFSEMDVRDSVAAALSMMEPQLKSREVRITRNIPREPVMIMGDRLRLEQVLINLLRNALDATKLVDSPQVDVIVSIGDSIVVSVRDNGNGIDNLDSLFEPFYTTKAPGDGVGLGLAISSGIVTDLGGRLTARNGQDGGAVFEVELPKLT